MTPEELLRPRYLVAAGYPNMAQDQIGVGDIISPYSMGFMFPEKVKEKYDSFPHLFKRLEWWEHREEKDMPEYLRYAEMVLKVKEWAFDSARKDAMYFTWEGDDVGAYVDFQPRPTPATETEYNNYKNIK